MKIDKTIIFGPTGAVGSNAALKAHKLGAEVTLAMRDTSKPIPGLSEEDEKAGKYKRVQADLGKVDSVSAAVKQSGAQSAFVYNNWDSKDYMAGTFQALKDGGVKLVVYLSSCWVPDKEKQMEKLEESAHVIAYVHTQAELALAKVFAKTDYVALRPGYFASNVLFQKFGIIAGSVNLLRPDLTWDYIAPEDIGESAGNILARGQRDNQTVVLLFGPDELTQREAFLKAGTVLGKELVISEATTEETRETLAASVPEVVLNALIADLTERKQGDGMVSKKKMAEGQANVEKYAARPGMRLDDWVSKNIDLFATRVEDVAEAMPESAPEPEEPEEEEEEKEGEGEEGEKKEGEGEDGKEGKEGKDGDDDDDDKKGKGGK